MAISTNEIRRFTNSILEAIGRRMFGLESVVQLSLTALYTDGHVLLEANPGMGKTELVKAIAQVLQLDFGRIQFTPDLMPSDITGTLMPDLSGGQPGNWVFREGPVFTSLLLADEINRASPKTQSALLEAMAERQVTVLGQSHDLRNRRSDGPIPFMVLATQNPIDHEGTYELPEAQADRFLFNILLDPPGATTLHEIINKESNSQNGAASLPPLIDRARSIENYNLIKAAIKEFPVMDSLSSHIVNLVLASNHQFDDLTGLGRREVDELRDLTRWFRFGFGARAAIGLMLATKAWALFWGENTIDFANGSHLVEVLVPTLRHRMHMRFDWEREFAQNQGRDPSETADWSALFLRELCLKTAPGNDNAYARIVQQALQHAHEEGAA